MEMKKCIYLRQHPEVASAGTKGELGMSTMRAIRVVAAVVVVVLLWLFLRFTDHGASLMAGVKCAPTWLTSDRAAYQTCYDVEREQIVEERAPRHTPRDE